MVTETVGQRLRRMRKERGLSAAKLGRQIGYPANTITYWERDERLPTAIPLIDLADFYECSIDYILRGYEI